MRRLPVLPADPPTASRVGLAMRCVYPWTSGQRAPRLGAGVAPGDEAQIGTVVHAASERVVRGEEGPHDLSKLDEDARETADDMIEVATAFIVDERERQHRLYVAEMPVEIDVATGEGRVLPSRGHRDYSARSPRAIAGTADHVLWPEGGKLTVRDWKTGQQRGLAHEAARMQVRTLGLALAAIYQVDEVVTEVASISTSGVDVEREHLNEPALEEHAEALRVLAARLTSGPQKPAPGPWCVEMFCPLLGECPASRGALAAVTREEPVIAITDDATALRAIDLLPRMRAALAAIEDALEVYVKRSPPRGADGRIYGYQDHKRREVSVKTPEQMAALREVLGEHVFDAVTMKTVAEVTLKSIERAARRKLAKEGKKRGITELAERAVASLASKGGVYERVYQRPAWFWPEGSQQPGEGTRDLPMTGDEEYG